MFDPETCYAYYRVGDHSGVTLNRKYVQHLTIYCFNTKGGKYLVEVEQYKYDIYIIKFYRRKDKGNKERYNIITGQRICSRIIGTCLQIFMDIYRKNPMASFGFLGANTIDRERDIIEPKNETKRFRVYEKAVVYYFGEKTFTHFSDRENSTYLAISNLNKNIDKIKDEADKIIVELVTCA